MTRTLLAPLAAGLVFLALSSTAHGWGAFHAGFNHYGPVTGFDHVGVTGFDRGLYGGLGGGYHYSGYHYGGFGGYGATVGGGYRYGGYGAGYHYGGLDGYRYGAYGYRRVW